MVLESTIILQLHAGEGPCFQLPAGSSRWSRRNWESSSWSEQSCLHALL